MALDHAERGFETAIEDSLLAAGSYTRGGAASFDAMRACPHDGGGRITCYNGPYPPKPPRRRRLQPMHKIALDAEAGQVSAELARRGIPAALRVHVLVEVPDQEAWPMAALAQAGGGFDWLAEEPDLYTDADLKERAG